MESGVPLATESRATTRKVSRRRPLHTWGVSILEIVDNVCTKAQNIGGPIGLVTKRTTALISSASPIIYAMQYQMLAILSFADDLILGSEDIVETIFPPSTRIFNKIDDFVYAAEFLPEKVDNVMNKFTTIIHHVPIVSGLVSSNLDENSASENSHIESGNAPSNNAVVNSQKTYVRNCSYKEALEKGTKGDNEKKEDSVLEESPQSSVTDEDIWASPSSSDDPIVDLFESSWHMNSGKGGRGSSLSLSFTST